MQLPRVLTTVRLLKRLMTSGPLSVARPFLVCGLLQLAATARADGVMSVGTRELFREGPSERGYCGAGAAQDECDRVKTKVLSGYGFLRGHVAVGVSSNARSGGTSGAAALRVAVASGALPGGDLAVATVDGVIDTAALRRLRVTLLKAEGLFFCHDAQSGKRFAPVLGMMSRECLPNAVVAVDAGLFAAQWEATTRRFTIEWLHAGPALELLGNGLGHAHLLRSVMIALPFDLRSVENAESRGTDPTSLGAGLRFALLHRTPHWETGLDLRHRAALAGGAGALRDNTLQAELQLLHNFFLIDALVVQAGLSLRGMWAQRPENSFVAWAATDQRWLGFAGVYLGWISEPPDL